MLLPTSLKVIFWEWKEYKLFEADTPEVIFF